MLGPQRRFLLCLTALAAVCVAAQAVTGISELALYLTSLFLIGALLLSGRFIGEERIVARVSDFDEHRAKVEVPVT